MYGISDLYIQNTSGIPYVARCYGGDECENNPSHSLMTGFFAAINAFKGELGRDKLTTIGFDEFILIVECSNDIMVVVGVESHDHIDELRKVATDLGNEFNKRYSEVISQSTFVETSQFNEFTKFIDKTFEQTPMGDMIELFQPKEGLWSKLKRKLFN
jgi:hypothetical protein